MWAHSPLQETYVQEKLKGSSRLTVCSAQQELGCQVVGGSQDAPVIPGGRSPSHALRSSVWSSRLGAVWRLRVQRVSRGSYLGLLCKGPPK